jgi:hypothetical protein
MSIPASTTIERTYRYLRIGVAGTVVVIFVAVGVSALSVGWLPSVSDYYFTPARNAFVGALCAVTLGLIALSGRGAERALLDAAALFPPLIAFVPTAVVPGSTPGVEVSCASACFPPAYEPDAAAGVATYVLVGALIVAVALLLAALGQVALRAVGLSLAVTTAVLAVVGFTWLFAREAFLAHGHFVATTAFFLLFAAVALLNAFPRRGSAPSQVYRVLYTAIATGLVVVMIAYVLLLPTAATTGIPIVLIAEGAALTLFAAFWVVQSIEKWNDTDPTLL